MKQEAEMQKMDGCTVMAADSSQDYNSADRRQVALSYKTVSMAIGQAGDAVNENNDHLRKAEMRRDLLLLELSTVAEEIRWRKSRAADLSAHVRNLTSAN
jgi:hypothetical protein